MRTVLVSGQRLSGRQRRVRSDSPITLYDGPFRGQLKKLPESKPGMAVLQYSSAGAYIVDAFR
ncbi:hypothetical protein [Pyxidicoccus trucidator]|uniref:hypothetical protein n=1 Tax=Pyxidicoccus trucidator TaxID=2709662 RepID=UPI0030840516